MQPPAARRSQSPARGRGKSPAREKIPARTFTPPSNTEIIGEYLLPAATDYYWRRDMNSGVEWPSTGQRHDLCHIKAWQGYSDAKGNLGLLANDPTKRGGGSGGQQPLDLQVPLSAVMGSLEMQLIETFDGRGTHMQRMEGLRQLKAEGLEWLFSARARVLEADGTALRARTLWVAPMGFGERLP